MRQGLSNLAQGFTLFAASVGAQGCLTEFPNAAENPDARPPVTDMCPPLDVHSTNGQIMDAIAPDAFTRDAGAADMFAAADAQMDATLPDAAPDQGASDSATPDFRLDLGTVVDAHTAEDQGLPDSTFILDAFQPDAAQDACPDFGAADISFPDAESDATPDAAPDSEPDMTFLPVDAEADAAADSATDLGFDAEADAQTRQDAMPPADAAIDAEADATPDAAPPFEELCPPHETALDCRFAATEVGGTSLVYRNPDTGELEILASLPLGVGFHVDVVRSCMDVGRNPVAVGAHAPVSVVCRTINAAVRADIYEQQLREGELPIPEGIPDIADAPVADGVNTPRNRSAMIVFRSR